MTGNIHKYSCCVFLFLVCLLDGQNHKLLLEKKHNLIKESKELSKALIGIQSNQKHTIEELALVNKRVNIQENILELLEKEVQLLITEQTQTEQELQEIVKQLESVKESYRHLIRQTNQLNLSYNRLLFFLSSTNFNQLIRRAYHFRQIEINRRKKYEEIQKLQSQVKNKKSLIIEKKASQVDLTFAKQEEINALNQIKSSQKETISFLKTKEDSLSLALRLKEQQTKKITKEILALLEAEKSKNKSNNLTPEARILSSNFSSNKGRLPWPVSKGVLISQFGKNPHPILSGITIMNNGVEIATNNNRVRSVFDGQISRILVLPNGLKVVIIRHGEYLTVYSNLYDVNIQNGQKIKTKDYIGTLYNDKNKKNNILGFQIWKDREKLNPSQWLSSY